MTGLHAEVCVTEPTTCPVAQLSATADCACHSVRRAVGPGVDSAVAEEFATGPDSGVDESSLAPWFSRVFDTDNQTVYRFSRTRGRSCPCEVIDRFETPLTDVRARHGDLVVGFNAPDVAAVQRVVEGLRRAYPVELRRLVRDEGDSDSLVLVDRAALTDRQVEVLTRAHELGYFAHPRAANAGEVATDLGITRATFAEHLANARATLLEAVLDV
ncbi:MAG: helix-turn-helix domain-containing protein [Haloarculaceae archaeon]